MPKATAVLLTTATATAFAALHFSMMTREQHPELASHLQAFLEKRRLSILAASERFGIDRGVLTRMQRGIPPSVEVVERFALAIGEDVNRWRELCGYPRVDSEPTGRQIYLAGRDALAREFQRPIVESYDESALAELTVDDAFKELAWLRKQLEEGTV